MTNTLTYSDIPAKQILYDRESGLFPFSPRTKINTELVTRLKDSITEVGMIQPVILRRGAMEGIAGNHRFLAYLQWAVEQGQAEGEITVPAILVECDEATAVSIALIENKIRNDLTEWEAVRALLQVTKRKPGAAERVFKMDRETARQLEFWPDQLKNAEVEEHRYPMGSSRLTREWSALINDRLALHPDLRRSFLNQLRQPAWVNARTIAILEQEINEALLAKGIKFESGRTWNCQPTDKCLANQVKYEQISEKLCSSSDMVRLLPDGSIPNCCPFLRLVPHYIHQVSSDPKNGVRGEVDNPDDHYGFCNREILDQIEAYCVSPDVHEKLGCFHQQELGKIESLLRELEAQGLPAMSPTQFEAREADGEFVWRSPVREGQPCTPDTCRHAGDTPRGYALLVQPSRDPLMICLHSECGKAAQAAFVDHEALQRVIEQQHYREALDLLCQETVRHTLFLQANGNEPLLTPPILEEIERLLVPNWDTQTMRNVVAGWQRETCHRIAGELGLKDLVATHVIREFGQRFGELASKPDKTNTRALFYRLRELMIAQNNGLERWVACLAVARSWRDTARTIQEIEKNPLVTDKGSI